MLLDKGMAEAVLEQATPLICTLMDRGVVKRSDLHTLVAVIGDYPAGYFNEPQILAQQSFGDRESWERNYAELAMGKMKVSAKTGLNSRMVQLERPWLLEPGDVKFWGSWVRDNMIVATSGVEPYYDEAISEIIIALLGAAVQKRAEQLREQEGDFFASGLQAFQWRPSA